MATVPDPHLHRIERATAFAPLVERISDELRLLACRRVPSSLSSDRHAGVDPGVQAAELANIIYRHRRRRSDLNPMFGCHEPNWHMALRLYLADTRGTGSATLAELTRAAGLGERATRRRLVDLATLGVVDRAREATGRGGSAYRLTVDGRRRVETYLASIVALIG